jgi:hypothetical protein
MALSLVSSQFKTLISDHALMVVSKVNASPSNTSNDLLATLLKMGSRSSSSTSLEATQDLGHCPPDALDVSTLALFRQTRSEEGELSSETISEVSSSDIAHPDVLISFSSGLSFTAHSSILAARSRFFEKALQYHSPLSTAGMPQWLYNTPPPAFLSLFCSFELHLYPYRFFFSNHPYFLSFKQGYI